MSKKWKVDVWPQINVQISEEDIKREVELSKRESKSFYDVQFDDEKYVIPGVFPSDQWQYDRDWIERY